MTEQRIHAAVVREGTEEERAETDAAFPAESLLTPTPTGTTHSIKQRGRKDITWEESRCHICSGQGNMKSDCPSPRKMIKAPSSTTYPGSSEPALLHCKTQGQEMSIHMLVYEL